MIQSKIDLYAYMAADMAFFHRYAKKDQMIARLTRDPVYQIVRYLQYLRKEEYYFNVRKDKIGTICYLYYYRKKNNLGNQLGFKIPKNCFGPGVEIYHHGCVIVNESARIGAYCKLHGNNCIGNNGKTDRTPVIGDYLNLGFGASVIGDVSLGNNISVGANAVVVHDYLADFVTLVGVPAKKINSISEA